MNKWKTLTLTGSGPDDWNIETPQGHCGMIDGVKDKWLNDLALAILTREGAPPVHHETLCNLAADNLTCTFIGTGWMVFQMREGMSVPIAQAEKYGDLWKMAWEVLKPS